MRKEIAKLTKEIQDMRSGKLQVEEEKKESYSKTDDHGALKNLGDSKQTASCDLSIKSLDGDADDSM